MPDIVGGLTITNLPADPATGTKQDASNTLLDVVTVKLDTLHSDNGIPVTGQSLEIGGVGVIGWLSSVRKKLADALGAATDAAVSTDADGSINAHIRGLVKLFAGTLFDATNQLRVSLYGQKSNPGDAAIRIRTPADSLTPIDSISVISASGLYNGSTLDLLRNNVEGIALASAVRNSTTNSPDIVNYNHKGIAVILNVTSASGTGGLQIRVQAKDPVSGNYVTGINPPPTAVTTVTTTMIEVYPGISSPNFNGYSYALPRTFRISITHVDSSNYTYSVGYCLLS